MHLLRWKKLMIPPVPGVKRTAGTTLPKDVTRESVRDVSGDMYKHRDVSGDNGFMSEGPSQRHSNSPRNYQGPRPPTDTIALEHRVSELETTCHGLLSNQEILISAMNALRTAVETYNLLHQPLLQVGT